MKRKKFFILVVSLIIIVFSIFSLRSYVTNRTEKLAKGIGRNLSKAMKGDVYNIKVQKIIKITPAQVVMIISFGKGNKAYLTANKWLTNSYQVEVDIVEHLFSVY